MADRDEATPSSRNTRSQDLELTQGVTDPERIVRTASRVALPTHIPHDAGQSSDSNGSNRLAENFRRRLDASRNSSPEEQLEERRDTNLPPGEAGVAQIDAPRLPDFDLQTNADEANDNRENPDLDSIRDQELRNLCSDIQTHQGILSILQTDVNRLPDQVQEMVHTATEATLTDAFASGEFKERIIRTIQSSEEIFEPSTTP